VVGAIVPLDGDAAKATNTNALDRVTSATARRMRRLKKPDCSTGCFFIGEMRSSQTSKR
jgi:hypothetical protein